MPTLVRTAPAGPNWLHEIKHDGYRTICVVDQGAASIYTRRGHNWADRMASIGKPDSLNLSRMPTDILLLVLRVSLLWQPQIEVRNI